MLYFTIGSLSTATSGAVTSTYNAATGVWTASGAVAAVNALLAGVTLTPAANFNGSFSIATSVFDGVAPAITGSKAFTGIAVNDAPTATNLSTAETYTENTPLNLVDIVVSDADSANVTATLTLSNPAAGSLSTATSGAVTSTYNAATGVWTASGAVAAVNALLAGVTLTPAANFNGSFSIATSVFDGVAPAITGSKAFTGIAVNDAPTATNLSTAETYTENTPLNLVDIVVSDADSANVTATLTLSNPAAGSLSTATSGAVTSTYNAATGVWTASGAVAAVNALLAGVTLTPAANFNGSFSIATSVFDGVAPAITGSKAFTGIAVNDAPTATNLSTAETYTENTPLNLVDIVVSDADSANVTATLTLSNPAAGSLSTATSGAVTSTHNAATGVWTASGAVAAVNALLAGVTLTPAANFNGSFSIATSVFDGVAPAITGSKAFTGTTFIGDSDNNSLIGTVNADTLRGLAGNDRLQGLAGNDVLDGGLGFDRAIYTDAAGGVIVNLAVGTAFGAGVGTDTLVGIESAAGSDFSDTFNAAGFDGLSGLPGVIAGLNEFEGRGGNDLIIGGINAQGQVTTRISYQGATGAVTVDIAAGTADGDVSVGHDTFSNVNSIFGSAFIDTFYGSDNANFTYETYEGRGGDDFIDGRGGYDSVIDPATTSGITVHLADGNITGDTTVGTDTIRNVEAARGTNFDDVFDATGYGSAGALNVSTTNGTFNDFGGAGGNDTIIGNGNTRLNYIIATASVSVDLETGAIGTTTAITVAGSATGATEGTDTFTGVNAVQGSMFNDTLLGSSFSNTFTGLGGNDLIDGRGGFDTASYNSLSTVTSGVNVNMATGAAVGITPGDASIGTDTLRNIEGIQGTMLADTYNATGYGLAGAANVSTSNGNFNQFEGLGGDDVVTGNGNTRVIYSNATAGVTITIGAGGAGSAHGTASGDTANVGNDSFTGGVNSAMGSNFADTIIGSSASETLDGNGGNDTLNGGGGLDTFFGGAGSDNFIFASGSTAGATVVDFAGNGDAAGDTLEFHGFGTATNGASLTYLSGVQWQVHSGLDGHNEIITLNGVTATGVHLNDYQFLS